MIKSFASRADPFVWCAKSEPVVDLSAFKDVLNRTWNRPSRGSVLDRGQGSLDGEINKLLTVEEAFPVVVPLAGRDD